MEASLNNTEKALNLCVRKQEVPEAPKKIKLKRKRAEAVPVRKISTILGTKKSNVLEIAAKSNQKKITRFFKQKKKMETKLGLKELSPLKDIVPRRSPKKAQTQEPYRPSPAFDEVTEFLREYERLRVNNN